MIQHFFPGILFSLLLVPGIIMAIVPGLPGLLYMFIVSVVFALTGYGTHMTGRDILILGIITVIAMSVDFFAGVFGAKWGGAHWSSFFSGIAGLILGSVFIPIPIFGSMIGIFFGVLASELYRTRKIETAGKAALYSFLGSIVGMVVNLFCTFLFVALALYFFFK